MLSQASLPCELLFYFLRLFLLFSLFFFFNVVIGFVIVLRRIQSPRPQDACNAFQQNTYFQSLPSTLALGVALLFFQPTAGVVPRKAALTPPVPPTRTDSSRPVGECLSRDNDRLKTGASFCLAVLVFPAQSFAPQERESV